jgi:hypothetical protein
MTKKDYEALAAALNDTRPGYAHPEYATWHRVVQRISGTLAKDNRLFSEPKFMEACGVPSMRGTH